MTAEEYKKKCQKCLATLFSDAKSKDEFEYICALLRISGTEAAGWEPLRETSLLVEDLTSLINTPLQDHTRLRLALLTYCHIVEVDTIYGVIENMLSIIEGKRCTTEPFWDLYKSKVRGVKSRLSGVIPPSSTKVVKHLCEHATIMKREEIKEILELMFDENIRNTFFHSDYVIFKDEYRSPEKGFAIKIIELSNLINRGIIFFHVFMQRLNSDIQSYKSSKVILGRINGEENPPVEIELDVHPEHGLSGFHSPPDNPKICNDKVA